jgi:hypothetical protein
MTVRDIDNNGRLDIYAAGSAIFGAYPIQLFISIRLSMAKIDSCSNVFNKILHLLRET